MIETRGGIDTSTTGTENVTESLPGTHGGMQRDAEHTGEAENKWGPLGGTKGIYVQHLGKSQGNSRGNPPFNG